MTLYNKRAGFSEVFLFTSKIFAVLKLLQTETV